MLTAHWTRGRLTALRTVLAVALALCTSVGVAAAAPRTFGSGGAGPVIDGNGDDLIQYAGTIGQAGCSVDIPSARGNIRFTAGGVVVRPCAPLEDINGDGTVDYWVNGSDLRRFVAVREGTNLYLLFRTEGFIGDVDGNLNPDNFICAPPAPPSINTFDAVGIGSSDRYQAEIDLDCNGDPDIFITVTDNVVKVTNALTGDPLPGITTQFAFRDPLNGGIVGASGRDLEVAVGGITLGDVFKIKAKSGSFDDIMEEDLTEYEQCGNPAPSVLITKQASVPSICVGQTVDFTITVTNNGNVALPALTVVDDLDAGLVYQQTVSNTCGGAVNAIGNQITYGPFALAAGSSCTIVLRAGRTAECQGLKTNNVQVNGLYQNPCFEGGVAREVGPQTASATVLCGNAICSITPPSASVCVGGTTQLCGPEGNFGYAWSRNGQPLAETTRCITVGVGNYSLVITDRATGCVSNNTCQATVTENPPPPCTITPATASVCIGGTTQLCGPVGNFGYAWSRNGQPLAETTRCITVGVGNYSLVTTDLATNCVSTSPCQATVTENPPPPCPITADKLGVCANETAQLCGPEGPFSYAWTRNGQPLAETTRCINVGPGTYVLVTTNTQTGCVSRDDCTKTIVLKDPPCVEVTVNAPEALCAGAAFELCGTVRNCGTTLADLEVDYNGVKRNFAAVPAGESRPWCVPAVMPNCTGEIATFNVTAKATNDCGPITQPGSDTVQCKVPQIHVVKSAREASVPNLGTIHYSITVSNPSSTVALEDVIVVDDLCAYAKWTGVASPTPTSAPGVGTAGGLVTWNIGNLAPLQEVVITFEVTADVAAGGGVCPTTVDCQNDVEATGLCAGAGPGQPRIRDTYSIRTPITCAGEACPRTVGFWGAQCAQRGNGSTKFTRDQVTQIASCIDDRSAFFNWASGTDFEMFCRALSTSNMTQRVQAKRQFAGVLANMCTDALNLQPSQGGKIFLDPSTSVSCSGLTSTTLGALVDEVDAILAELEGMSLNDPTVKNRYGQLISCLDAINNGTNISVRSDCEHGGTTTPTGDADEVGDGASVDAGVSVELYRPYPNPFTGATAFAYKVDASDATVDITVYDVSGRQIRKLVSGVQAAGQYTANWDGRNDAGVKATRGVYFVRTIIAGAKANTNRVLYLSE